MIGRTQPKVDRCELFARQLIVARYELSGSNDSGKPEMDEISIEKLVRAPQSARYKASTSPVAHINECIGIALGRKIAKWRKRRKR